jgi:hypothetical protein
MNLVTQRMTALAALRAATVMAACGLRSTNSSSETLTVYEDAPTLPILTSVRLETVRATCIIFLLRCALAPAVRLRARYLAQRH